MLKAKDIHVYKNIFTFCKNILFHKIIKMQYTNFSSELSGSPVFKGWVYFPPVFFFIFLFQC